MASPLSPISEGVGRRSGLRRHGFGRRRLGFPALLAVLILAVVALSFGAGYLFGRTFLT